MNLNLSNFYEKKYYFLMNSWATKKELGNNWINLVAMVIRLDWVKVRQKSKV